MTIFKFSSVVLVAALVMSSALACGLDSKPKAQQQSDEQQTD